MSRADSNNPARMPTILALVEDWCGERLTPEVARRLSGMPHEQRQIFNSLWKEWAEAATLSPRPPGTFRAFSNAWGLNDGVVKPRQEPNTLRPLLLYAHQVVVSLGAVSLLGDRLAFLADYRDLIDADVLLTLPHMSDAPTEWPEIESISLKTKVDHEWLSELDPAATSWLSELDPANPAVAPGMMIWLAQLDARRQLIEAYRCDTDIVFTSRLSERAFEHYCTRIEVNTRRSLAAERLLNCVLPDGLPTPDQIWAVRKSDAAFAEWRSQLTTGLMAVDALTTEYDWRSEAPLIMAEHLSASAEALRRTVGRTAALATLRNSATTFGIAAVGAYAGALAGGTITASLANVGSASALGLVAAYLQQANQRRLSSALMAHYYSFVPSGPSRGKTSM